MEEPPSRGDEQNRWPHFQVCEVRVAPDGDWPRLRQAPLESALESAEVQLAAAKCQETSAEACGLSGLQVFWG